jgi:pimeloyl-ACP methyl ester carboxylesterase
LFQGLRTTFSILAPLSPTLAGRWADFLFRTPLRQKRLKREMAWLARGRFALIPFRDSAVASWTWGEGPLVVLVHGWTGHAGRLTPYVPALVDAGFSVVAFDAPGHGISPGFHSSVRAFTDAITSVATHHGPVYGFVAHSLGSAAVIMAMSSGVVAERAVFLGPATDPEQYSGRFARTLRIPECVRESMKRSIERRFGVPWESFRVIEKASKMTSALMVFHDRRDSQVPFADGAAIAAAWPGAELVPTRGLGHHKILREPAVIFRAVSFLASGRAGLASETVAASVFRSS